MIKYLFKRQLQVDKFYLINLRIQTLHSRLNKKNLQFKFYRKKDCYSKMIKLKNKRNKLLILKTLKILIKKCKYNMRYNQQEFQFQKNKVKF